MKNTKTCFILRMPPPYGGGEIVSQLLYEGLRNDYDFFLIRRTDHSKTKQQNISVSSYLNGLKYILGILFYIRKSNPSKIYIGLPKTIGAFLRNAVIICFCHYWKIIVYGELHGMSFPFLKKKRYYWLFRIIINKIFKIRVLSNSIKDYLYVNGFRNKIEVIDNAIRKPEITSKVCDNNTKKINLLYLGLISESKGFQRLIEIIKEITEDYPNKMLINVIGEWHSEPFKKSCINEIEKSNLTDFFVFHGPLYNEEKWGKIIENDIIVHLSSFDGQPLSIIECMSLGIPAIATKVGAIPEMIVDRDNGFLIENDGEATIIIRAILDFSIDLTEMKNNCIKTYETRFAPEILINKIKSFIET